MIAEPNLTLLFNVIAKIVVFSGRPGVRIQILAVSVTIIVAGIISKFSWLWLEKRLTILVSSFLREAFQPYFHFSLAMIKAMSFPILSIFILGTVAGIMSARGLITGLLSRFVILFWMLISFRLALSLISLIFEERDVKKHLYRLLIPLLSVVVFLHVLSNLASLRDIAGIVLVTLFNTPVTLGALFLATFGLYFWTDIVYVIQDVVYELIQKYTKLDAGNAKAKLTLIRYILLISGTIYAFGQLRLDARTIAAVSGGLSVGVGFGLREILSNFISGILLLFERSLHPGDVIEVDNQISIVEDLSIRATTLRTLDNVELVIPNQTFLTASFKTFTGTDKVVRVPVMVRANCENDLETVIKLLKQTACRHREVLQDRKPSVFLLDFGDNIVNYQLNIWLDSPLKIPKVVSDIKRMVWQAFVEHDIQLTFPDMALHFPEDVPHFDSQLQKNLFFPTPKSSFAFGD